MTEPTEPVEPIEPVEPTDPVEPIEPVATPDGIEPADPVEPVEPVWSATPRHPPGASIFTIEGRAAPGLYFVGWIASLLGLGILIVGTLSSGGPAPIVLSAVGAGLLSLGLVAGAGSQAIERRARGESAYVGPSPFLVFAATVPLSILLVILVIGPAILLGLDPGSSAATVLSFLATALVYVALIRFLVVGTGALDWKAMGVGPLTPAAVGDLAWGAVLAAPIILVTGLLSALLIGLTGAVPESPLPTPDSTLGLAINVIAATILAPITEELFFRGFATTAWAHTMGSRRALVQGAIFFAFVHVLTIGGATFGDAVGRALVAFVARLPVSFALGWVFLRRRSLYASIGLHAAYNGLLLVLSELVLQAIRG